jgi:hypothetical protein
VKDYLSEPDATDEKKPADEKTAGYRTWLDRVKKREKSFSDGWWKMAEESTKLFNYEKEDAANPYNILYSNTEVLKPSLYSATPKPDVRGRFVENPVSPLTKLVEHFLIVFSDPANPGEESLDKAMDECVTSALVAGTGFIRLRHYPDRPVPLCTEAGHYKGLIWPHARKWSKLPWISFRHEMQREDFFAQFGIKGEEKGKLKVNEDAETDDTKDDNTPKCLIVYEVWKKEERKVCYYCEDWEPLLVLEEDDPMGLQGFYPTPGPLVMTHKPGTMVPTPLYQYYRSQAEELNRVTTRLNKVLSAIRVRGAYSSLLGKDLENIVSENSNENILIAAGESTLLLQNGGFDKLIWMLPIEKLITVATELYNARMQIKQVIYEITGLSDIIRGSSVASETATAQNLKNKWGSIRLRDMQKAVAGYVRDIYRLTVDAASTQVPADRWKAITQAPIPTQEEQEIARQRVKQLIEMAQQQAMQAQAAGQQPQIQPPPPELMAAAKSPDTIESLLKQIQSDSNRTFTINVQSDSTVDIDTATDKIEVTEFMNAMGQLMAGLQPLATLGPTGLNVAKEIMIAVCSRFKFGLSILDSLKALQPPPPQAQGPTPEQQKALAEIEKKENELKQLLEQVEDGKREIETAKKEWEADVKIENANRKAQEEIFNAKQGAAQQVQQASQKAADAEQNAKFVDRKTQLTSATAQLKGQQKATKQVADETAPVKEGVTQLQQAVTSVTQQLESLAKTVGALQQQVSESTKKPKRVVRKGDSFVPEY